MSSRVWLALAFDSGSGGVFGWDTKLRGVELSSGTWQTWRQDRSADKVGIQFEDVVFLGISDDGSFLTSRLAGGLVFVCTELMKSRIIWSFSVGLR
jgi:hypothetical protein